MNLMRKCFITCTISKSKNIIDFFKGETPLDMAVQNKNQLIIHMLKTEAKRRVNKKFRLWRWLHKCEVFCVIKVFVSFCF